jgi:aspartyl-tRNA(Asn)/glutamyl-tRNA(Gln) amidotransferase subunit B
MNSFRFLEHGIRAEIARQQQVLSDGGAIVQETLHYDPAADALTSLRSKEEVHDYRYFPDPDLIPVAIDEQMLERAREALPELPAARAERFESELGLTRESAQLLAFRAELGDYLEAALEAGVDPAPPAQALANWVGGELLGRLGDGEDPASSLVTPAALASLVGLLAARRVSVGAARAVLDELAAHGGSDPGAIIEREGLAVLDEGEELAAVVAAALRANADAAERVRAGNDKAIGPIVGAVMRETKGRADGGEVQRLVREQLGI